MSRPRPIPLPPLPRLLVLTDRSVCTRPLPDVVAAAVEAGARAVVLREKDLPARQRELLATELTAILAPVGGTLVVAGPPAGSGPLAAGVVHLSAYDEFPAERPRLVGRSCHSADELARARREGCDHVTLSPVFPTRSKPGYGPVLGIAGLASLAPSGPPAYALGGVQPADVADCLLAGAWGVAVLGPVMRDPQIVSAYLSALPEQPTWD